MPMDAIYLTLLPILGLVAYPNWKGVLRLSFALSLLSWEVIALSKAFQDPIVGLGFGMLSLGVPYSILRSTNGKEQGLSGENVLISAIIAFGIAYLVYNGGIRDFVTTLKVVAIMILDGLGIAFLNQKLGKCLVISALSALWILTLAIEDPMLMVPSVITTLLGVLYLHSKAYYSCHHEVNN